MKCFSEGFIGVKAACQDPSSRSGLFIDDLPGMSLERAAGTVGQDGEQSGRKLFRNAERLAYEMTMQDFKGKLTEKFHINEVIDTLKVSNSGLGQYELIGSFELDFYKNLCDDYSQMKLITLDFTADSAQADLVVTIEDNGVTETFTFDIAEGRNRLNFNYVSSSDHFKVTFSPTFEIFTTNVPSIQGDCLPCSVGGCMSINSKADESYSFKGVGVLAQCVCDLDYLSCMFEDQLKYAVWYRMGVLLVEYAQTSDRINPYVKALKDNADMLLLKWWGGTDPKTGYEVDGEYWRKLTTAVKLVKNSLEKSSSPCFTCNDLYFITNQL